MLFHVIRFSSFLTFCYAGQSDGCLVYDTYGTLIFFARRARMARQFFQYVWHVGNSNIFGM